MISIQSSTHGGLVTPYGFVNLDQHWLRFSNICLRAISQMVPQSSIPKIEYYVSGIYPNLVIQIRSHHSNSLTLQVPGPGSIQDPYLVVIFIEILFSTQWWWAISMNITDYKLRHIYVLLINFVEQKTALSYQSKWPTISDEVARHIEC